MFHNTFHIFSVVSISHHCEIRKPEVPEAGQGSRDGKNEKKEDEESIEKRKVLKTCGKNIRAYWCFFPGGLQNLMFHNTFPIFPLLPFFPTVRSANLRVLSGQASRAVKNDKMGNAKSIEKLQVFKTWGKSMWKYWYVFQEGI